MHDAWLRLTQNLSHRISGPMNIRFILQPIMALIFATIGGLKDAKAGKAPYFWSLFTDPHHRVQLLKDGWKSVGKVFILAIKELHTLYAGEALIVALLLAIIPYLIVRGLVTRLFRKG